MPVIVRTYVRPKDIRRAVRAAETLLLDYTTHVGRRDDIDLAPTSYTFDEAASSPTGTTMRTLVIHLPEAE